MFVPQPHKDFKKRQDKITQKHYGHMAFDGRQVAHLIITKAKVLLEAFDHMLNVPTLRIIGDHIYSSRHLKICTDHINCFLALLF